MKQSEVGHGEIYYIDADGVNQVEVIPEFTMFERNRDEDVVDFKARITQHVKNHGVKSRGCQVIDIKWVGPLGYHQGYLEPPAKYLASRA
jgi:hypothetical protein